MQFCLPASWGLRAHWQFSGCCLLVLSLQSRQAARWMLEAAQRDVASFLDNAAAPGPCITEAWASHDFDSGVVCVASCSCSRPSPPTPTESSLDLSLVRRCPRCPSARCHRRPSIRFRPTSGSNCMAVTPATMHVHTSTDSDAAWESGAESQLLIGGRTQL